MVPAERSGPEDEKVTINLGPVDLGRVDLLVREGVFSSRTDFIRDAVRRQLEEHTDIVKEVVTRKSYNVGLTAWTKKDLEETRRKGERVRLRTVGVCIFGPGVTKQLDDDVFEDISVLGSVRGPKEVVDWVRSRAQSGKGSSSERST
jgi:Arc/MetJ-type ribon-helix-helix transcriptional regulator